jgi:hypothetical protein
MPNQRQPFYCPQVTLKSIEEPNTSLNVGIFSENMGNVPQLPLFDVFAKQKKKILPIEKNLGDTEIEHGALTLSDSKDYYLGEGVTGGF